MFTLEDELKSKGFDFIVGIDEAGRGPLAGPAVASAVIVHTKKFSNKISDSKKISVLQREKAFEETYNNAFVGVGIVEHGTIDSINILNATFLAMNNAVKDLVSKITHLSAKDDFKDKVVLLVDGNRFNATVPYKYRTIIEGDAKVFSIACASIIAKVTRDRIMVEYDNVFPEYGFKKHKGYPTKEHKDVLRKLGPTKIHRITFKY